MNDKELSSPVNMPYLPDDLMLNCLARVSRLYYPVLSLVSKRFRSLLVSTELYQTRTILGRDAESCLYVYFGLPWSSRPSLPWFTLCRKPNPKKKKEKNSSNNIIVSVPTCKFSPSCGSLIAFGSNIYSIGGGGYNGAFSSKVFFMDCRSHTWHEAPSMRVARKHPHVSVLDGKIYVVEGTLKNRKSSTYIECFDPKTQTWKDVQPPGAEILGRDVFRSFAIEGKLYLFGDKNVVYNPDENRWDAVNLNIDFRGNQSCLSLSLVSNSINFCVIDDVLYCSRSSKTIEWYDFKIRSWKILKGLEELLKLPESCGYARLVNYGGKIAALWEENVHAVAKKRKIWCAEIALDKRNEQEIYGKIVWFDVVLNVPKSYCFLQFVAATV